MKWIASNHELPECWSQHGSDYGSGYLIGYTKYDEVVITQLWNNREWEGNDDNESNYITHWMKLPLPPCFDVKDEKVIITRTSICSRCHPSHPADPNCHICGGK